MLSDRRAYLQRMHCTYEGIFTKNAGRHGVLLTEDVGGYDSLLRDESFLCGHEKV
jgi:hypothetical protein